LRRASLRHQQRPARPTQPAWPASTTPAVPDATPIATSRRPSEVHVSWRQIRDGAPHAREPRTRRLSESLSHLITLARAHHQDRRPPGLRPAVTAAQHPQHVRSTEFRSNCRISRCPGTVDPNGLLSGFGGSRLTDSIEQVDPDEDASVSYPPKQPDWDIRTLSPPR
jgi:hypothetical protein